jgi:hypothetical protein
VSADIAPGTRLLAVTGLLSRPGDVWRVVEHVVDRDWTCENERSGERAVWSLPDDYHFLALPVRAPLEAA